MVRDSVVMSFDAFYAAHRDRLYRALALTIRDTDLAREAVDEAMARAAQRWSQVGGYQAPEGWVYRVALNWSRSVFRRRARSPRIPVAVVTWDTLPDVDVNRAVAALPASHRTVVVARFYLDWSIEQIAAALQIPEGTVKSRLNRATRRLSGDLGGER
jgi:RNA polymerase sigma-70 factor (ECF subfamily)